MTIDEFCEKRNVNKHDIYEQCMVRSFVFGFKHVYKLRWNEKKNSFRVMDGRKIRARIDLNGDGYLVDNLMYFDTLESALDTVFDFISHIRIQFDE